MDEYEGGYKAISVVIRREMAERGMSIRQFAEFTGISATTINKCVLSAPGNPSLDMLIRLSAAIHISVCTLIGIAFPHVEVSPSPTVAYILERLEVMPDGERELINRTVSVLLQLPALSDDIKSFLKMLGGQ